MAVGRITGPLLKANLLRDGVDLAFETDLLYLDVNNGRVGIKTSLPDYDLDVNGTTRSTNVEVTNQADIATFTVTNNTISSSSSTINLEPAGVNSVVYQGKIVTGDLQLSTNVIETTNTDGNLNINTLGTGKVVVNSNMLVNGDIHATGNITADGSIQLGDANTDNIVFNADVNSNIIPDDNETWDLGSDPTASGKAWREVYAKDILATNVTADSILVDGIDLALVQGNIYYVATTGSNSNAGEHEHDPVLTLKYALSLANAGDCIYIFPGVYQEIFPLTVPAGVSVKGAGIRSVKITPTVGTRFNDAFLLNGETTIEDLTIADFFSTSTAQITLSSVLNNPNAYNTSSSDQFGWSVAVSDNYAIVGAVSEDDAGGSASGKAYIFNTTTGALVHTLNNPNAFSTSVGDNFGLSVGISGNYAIVSSASEGDAGGTGSGKVYIYNVTTGALIRTLNNPNAYSTSAGDEFGRSIAVSGNYAIVGAYPEDDAGGSASGKAYIFDLTHASTDSTTSVQVEFGAADNLDGTFTIDLASLGITDPGALIIINSVDIRGDLSSTATEYIDLKLSTAAGYNRYISAFDDATYRTFTWTGGQPTSVGNVNIDYIIPTGVNVSPAGMPDGYFWQVRLNITVTISALRHVLNNPNAYNTSSNDNFGFSVDISDNYAIVGAIGEDDAGGTSSGKAYVFNVASGALVQTLNNPNAFGTVLSDQFGLSVGISGNYAIVGAYLEDDAGGTTSGKAYIFNATTGALIHTLNNPNAYSTSASDQFGYSVDISGNYAIVSANLEDDAGGTSSGKVYIFSTISGQLLQTINNPNAYSTSASDQFGHIVAISGNYAMVGAIGEDDAGGTSSGKAYIYNLTGTVENGYAFRFSTGMTVTNRSPYIRNVTVITKGSTTNAGDPYGFSSGDAGKGALADGSVVNAASVEASMLFHSVTFITPNQEAVTATNGVRIEWLNSFSYFADKGLYLTSGPLGFAGVGQTRLRIENRTGTWAAGNTVLYYKTDGTTLLASGTISSINGNYVNLSGKCVGFETITDRVGKTVYAQGNAKLATAIKKFGTASLALDGTGDYASITTQPDFGFPSTISRIAKTITVNGNAAVSATESKFGGSSIAFDGTGDYLSLATDTDYGFGTGDFTIEGWFYKTAVATQYLFDTRTTLNENSIAVQSNGSGSLRLFVNGVFVLTSSNTHTNNAWNHLAISRASGVTRFFINGVVSTTTYTDATNYGTTKPLVVGAQYNGATAFAGYIDDFRVSNTARYTATFTPTTTVFVNDFNTKLLIHGDSTIVDDAGGGTATDFTMEAWIYPTVTTYHSIFDFRSASTEEAIYLGINLSNQVYLYVNGVVPITTTAISLNVWTHVAVVRYNATTKIYINGTQSGSSWADITNYGTTKPLRIGAWYNALYGFTGYIDDVKISKGVARYTTTFTSPTSAFVGDSDTVLLLHFNGANNSTTFLDDGVTLQDLRTSAGGTASLIQFADYSDFGAELRAIGSAAIYGNYGAYGEGEGVIAYLISQNFAYVGSGKVSTNDPNDRIAANEVVKLNSAKIYYTSVDNEGNFSVGDAFFVNQATGDVLFNGESLTITTPVGITFTDGVNSTTITPTNIDTGNIRISGNTIESLTGDVNVTAASGTINLQNNTYITGNLDVTGDITLGGNITIGDASTDTINFVGGINSNLVPATTATYDLGTTSLRWGNVYLSRAEIDGVVIDNNTIQTTIGNDNLTLQANGTGIISIPNNNVEIDQSLTVTTDFTVTTGTSYLKNTNIVGTVTQTGDIDQTGNFTTSGNTEVTGNITGTGYLRLPNIEISGNTITTRTTGTDLQLTANGTGNVVFEGMAVEDNIIKSTVTNSDITLTPQGTGSVIISSNQSLIIPVGDNSERPAVPTNGMIRYNDELGRYEGYNNGNWLALSGVEDADGNTYITAELTPGANDNTIRFYTDGNLMVTIDNTKLFAERLQTTNLDIQDDTISSISTNSDINLTSTGTGSVRVGNLAIKNNTITNVVSGAITDFAQSSTGYVKISGTNGVVIPTGDDFNRPGNPETGMMRYNTAQGLVEVYNGTIWQSVAGTGGGINYNDAVNIAVEYVLTFG